MVDNIKIADGTLEAIKWLAMLLMLADHVNKYALESKTAWAAIAGRASFPLFVMIFGYNLARANQDKISILERTIKRLFVFGVISTPPIIAIGGYWYAGWPLNALFSLVAIATIVYCWEKKNERDAILIFIFAGFLVEYFHAGLLLGIGAWAFHTNPSFKTLLIPVAGLLSLAFVNQSHWALLAVPIVMAATKVDLKLSRNKWLFYGFYPLHLAVLWLIRV